MHMEKRIENALKAMNEKNKKSLNGPPRPENLSPIGSRLGSAILKRVRSQDYKSLPENVKKLPVDYQDGNNPPDIPA